MQKLMLYAKKVIVTVTIDEREDPYRLEGEHQLLPDLFFQAHLADDLTRFFLIA